MTLETGSIYVFGQDKEVLLPESVSLFGFSIYLYGICLVLAAIIGVLVVVRESKKRKLDTEWFLAVIPLVLLFGILMARLYYAMFQWYPFSENPLLLFNMRSGGFAYFGALFGAWGAVKWYCKRKKTEFEVAADVLCMGASAAAVPVWIGCVLAREPIGRFYEGFFSVKISTEHLPYEAPCSGVEELIRNSRLIGEKSFISMHPIALYGVFASLLILCGLFVAKRFVKQSGQLFLLYLLLNSIAVLVLEAFRASRCVIWGTEIPVNSVIAGVLIVAVIGMVLWPMWRKKRNIR